MEATRLKEIEAKRRAEEAEASGLASGSAAEARRLAVFSAAEAELKVIRLTIPGGGEDCKTAERDATVAHPTGPGDVSPDGNAITFTMVFEEFGFFAVCLRAKTGGSFSPEKRRSARALPQPNELCFDLTWLLLRYTAPRQEYIRDMKRRIMGNYQKRIGNHDLF